MILIGAYRTLGSGILFIALVISVLFVKAIPYMVLIGAIYRLVKIVSERVSTGQSRSPDIAGASGVGGKVR